MKFIRGINMYKIKNISSQNTEVIKIVNKIERGDIGRLTIGELIKLADALQVTPTELFERILKDDNL